eukprot:530037_1
MGESVIILGNLLYFTIIDASLIREKYSFGSTIMAFAKYYRFTGIYFLLMLVTIFITVDFEAWKVPDYDVRRYNVLSDTLGLTIFAYCWITAVMWPCSVWLIFLSDGFEVKYSGRDMEKLVKYERWSVINELMAFGAPKISGFSFETELMQKKKEIDRVKTSYLRVEAKIERDYSGLIALMRLFGMLVVEEKIQNLDEYSKADYVVSGYLRTYYAFILISHVDAVKECIMKFYPTLLPFVVLGKANTINLFNNGYSVTGCKWKCNKQGKRVFKKLYGDEEIVTEEGVYLWSIKCNSYHCIRNVGIAPFLYSGQKKGWNVGDVITVKLDLVTAVIKYYRNGMIQLTYDINR